MTISLGSYMFFNLSLTSPSLDDDDKLDAIGLVQGPPPLLVEVSVAEVPANWVEKAEVIPGKFLVTCWDANQERFKFVHFSWTDFCSRGTSVFHCNAAIPNHAICLLKDLFNLRPVPLSSWCMFCPWNSFLKDDKSCTHWGRQFFWKSKSRLQIHLMWIATTPPLMERVV